MPQTGNRAASGRGGRTGRERNQRRPQPAHPRSGHLRQSVEKLVDQVMGVDHINRLAAQTRWWRSGLGNLAQALALRIARPYGWRLQPLSRIVRHRNLEQRSLCWIVCHVSQIFMFEHLRARRQDSVALRARPNPTPRLWDCQAVALLRNCTAARWEAWSLLATPGLRRPRNVRRKFRWERSLWSVQAGILGSLRPLPEWWGFFVDTGFWRV